MHEVHVHSVHVIIIINHHRNFIVLENFSRRNSRIDMNPLWPVFLYRLFFPIQKELSVPFHQQPQRPR